MTISAMHMNQGRSKGGAAYTVICKSGQRGMAFDDPRLAAQAFFHAREQDRPFVLQHRGNATYVIASAKAGAKQVIANWCEDETFYQAFELLAQRGRDDRSSLGLI